MVKKNYKTILIVIGSLILLYGIIWVSTRKPQMPVEYKTAIDSLTKANKVLADRQKQIDSTIASYQKQIYDLDYAVNNIKEKTIIIKEYYHEKIQQIDHYNATEIEKFFKTKYNY